MCVKQDDSKLVLQIQRWGCYFLSLHYYIANFKKLQFSINDINVNYHKFVDLGYMKCNCFILNPCKILKYYGINSDVRWEHHSYKCKLNEFEISEVKIKGIQGYHFMATNNSLVCYDSLCLDGKGKEYQVTSKRVFNKI
ncbi:DUF261 family protein (plasmid) [Borrelia coriaceae]|uniref:Uncharacterized protein n=1 Tax=Borrelia coriaceae ATCC 43381 TaxID=1408429 RepID=W5T353_9SPIR|nr:DUF261 family protein [Borrelia coriaceae]AHH11746.1 Hypothetical protein BCO_0010903 [Borrelia coriaceae ATCC 43381]UPA16860.1 DUF261 family protein [Borrelia coriaceae]